MLFFILAYQGGEYKKNLKWPLEYTQGRLLFTPSPGTHSNGIQPIEKSPLGEGLDARPITELAGCRAASARHRVNSNSSSDA